MDRDPEKTHTFGPGNQGVQVGSNLGTINNYLLGDSNQHNALSYLFLPDPHVNRSNVLTEMGDRVAGTCDWIQHETAFVRWLESTSSSLWLRGGPGKGKTMIALYVTETLLHLETQDPAKTTVLFFFCSEKSATQNNAIAILRGLLFQFIKKKPHLLKYCTDRLGKDNYKQTIASFGTLWDIFTMMLSDDRLGDIFCVLDGVDECEKASLTVLLRKLFTLFPKQPPQTLRRLKLFGISREIGGVNFSPDEVI
jgi:hypothetical protein